MSRWRDWATTRRCGSWSSCAGSLVAGRWCWSSTTWTPCSASRTPSPSWSTEGSWRRGRPRRFARARRCGGVPRGGDPVSALLEAIELHTFYGASHVLHGVTFSIEPGQTVTLMGRNGMGKTTTIRSVLGLTPPRSGEVRVDGKPVTGWPTHRIAAEGIALVPEGRGIFPSLSVRENLLVAQRPGRWTEERVLALFPRLRDRLAHLA